MKFSKTYITLVALLYAAFTIVFDTFPRSTVSQLEKRELATFPPFNLQKLADGSFTREVSSWFSDSEPYRDHLMALSMQIKDLIRLNTGEDNIVFHAATDNGAESANTPSDMETPDDAENYEPQTILDENAKIANAGIIITGQVPTVRALMVYGGGPDGCTGYAQAANKYKETFPDVNVYCMVIPTSVEYYCPEQVRKRTKPELPTIQNVIAHLSPSVKPVDIHATLGIHANEDIFLRTDHHWAPLGAFYAAKKFVQVAGVPFRDLDSYERRVVHGYVGSMYGYSKDVSVKQSPEDFVYYMPQDVDYQTTYIIYTINQNYQVTSESRPVKGPYFYHYKDGNGGAYCTFMGGDTKLTQVRTSTHNGRRVLILKDSFGNAIPGYLFYSFEEIHVVDSRYFTKNMVEYVRENHITDILFANNIFKAYSSHTYGNYVKFLTQGNGVHAAAPKEDRADSTNRHPAAAETPSHNSEERSTPPTISEPATTAPETQVPDTLS